MSKSYISSAELDSMKSEMRGIKAVISQFVSERRVMCHSLRVRVYVFKCVNTSLTLLFVTFHKYLLQLHFQKQDLISKVESLELENRKKDLKIKQLEKAVQIERIQK